MKALRSTESAFESAIERDLVASATSTNTAPAPPMTPVKGRTQAQAARAAWATGLHTAKANGHRRR